MQPSIVSKISEIFSDIDKKQLKKRSTFKPIKKGLRTEQQKEAAKIKKDILKASEPDIEIQSHNVEPSILGLQGHHETKASMMQKSLSGCSLSRADLMKMHGFAVPEPDNLSRPVIGYTGGPDSPFLNFTTGRSTIGENLDRDNARTQHNRILNANTCVRIL